jgi:hypothetical protein
VDETATGSVNLFRVRLRRTLFFFERKLMDTVLDLAARRGLALARQDFDTVAAQLHQAFVYVNADGHRLDRDRYLSFLADGPVRWIAQTLEDARVVSTGSVDILLARVVDEVVHDGVQARWEFVTTQIYVQERGARLYLAGHTALPAS